MAENGTNGNGAEPHKAPDQMEIAIETLSGDIRDELLREFKTMPKVYAKMDEPEQSRVIYRASDIADKLVRVAMETMAARGFEAFKVQLTKYVGDPEKLTFTLAIPHDQEISYALAKRCGSHVMVVALDSHEFFGERAPAKPEVVGTLAMPHGQQEEPKRGEMQERVDPTTGEVTSPPPPAPEQPPVCA